MEPKEGKMAEEGSRVSPATEEPEMSGASAKATTGPAGKTDVEDAVPTGPQGEAGRLEEEKQGGEPQKEAGGKEEAEAGPRQEAGGKEEAEAGPRQEAGGKEEAEAGPRQEAGGKEEAEAGPRQEAGGKEEAAVASLETVDRKEETRAAPREAGEGEEATPAAQEPVHEKEVPAEPEEKDGGNGKDEPTPTEAGGNDAVQEATAGPQKAAVDNEPPEADGKEEAERGAEEMEPRGPGEEQQQYEDREPEEGLMGAPSSPEEWPESPTEEGPSLRPDGEGPAPTASEESGPGDRESSRSESPPRAPEQKPEQKPERRASAVARPRGPRAQNRKAIVDKFGGAAAGPTALFRNTKAAGAAIGGVKSMLLEWCRAMTRKYEHVDVQNFSSSWSSGMAFCALIHKFFPDAFDYAALDPAARRHNFTLAFSTAEKLADCAQLLDVDDMVRLAVPDSKCVYTYIQELYRSLVQKGLVKTKKK